MNKTVAAKNQTQHANVADQAQIAEPRSAESEAAKPCSDEAQLISQATKLQVISQAKGLRAQKKQQTRASINRAALELALENGVSAVTVENIAAHAGVSTRTVFNYFATKEDALAGISSDFAERLAQQLRSTPAGLSLQSAVRQILLVHLQDDYLADRQLWLLRRKAAKNVELAAIIHGPKMRIECALVAAALERTPDNAAAQLKAQVTISAMLGAFRAALRFYFETQSRQNILTIATKALDAVQIN